MKAILQYILMFLALWGISLTILLKNFRDPYYRWLGVSFFVAGCASFAFSIPTTIIPFLRRSSLLSDGDALTLEWASIPFFLLYWYGIGYFFAMCSIYFAGFLTRSKKLAAAVLLALPPLANLALTGVFTLPFTLEPSHVRLLNGIYIVFACLIYIAGCVKEQDPYMRKNRYRTAFVLSTALWFSFVSDFVDIKRIQLDAGRFSVESSGYWQYNYLVILWIVLFFVFYGVKYGFLGIKLRIEEQKNDYSMQNLTHGAQILNHTIKNEIQKILYLNAKALAAIRGDKTEKAEGSLQGIEMVSNHMLEMVNRIRDKSENIQLNLRKERLSELIESSLSAIKTVAGERMEVQRDYGVDGELLCDPSHMREVLNNLVLNSLEAVPGGQAVIRIRTRLSGSKLLISVQDNGQGIAKENVGRIFAPFFSTKKHAFSYGLGLSYCYTVMQKHRGKIMVEQSEPGKGTTMLLSLPAKTFRKDAMSRSQM